MLARLEAMATDIGPGPGRFGALLQRHRVAVGLSQEELAERAGLSRRGISDLERGARRAPHPDTVRRLAAALRLDTAELAALLAAAHQRQPPSRPDPSRRGSHLPVPLTSFVGREREVTDIQSLLATARLVTLTGAGGAGKTRLALAVAAALAQHTATPACLVALAAIRDPTLVAGAIAAELGLREPAGGGGGIDAVVLEYLRDRQLLLVLDNLEQVLGTAALIAELLRAAPGVRVLATSRMPLRIYGEHEFRVPPLRLPGPGAAEHEVLASEAVALFVQRARAARADFQPSPAQAALLGAICRRLDGLPLAIELAAARVRHLALPALLDRLSHPLEVLDRGPHDVPARQRTLRATLDWSYALLPVAHQRLFERLGVFVGGCTVEAVRAICADVGEDVEDGVWELLDAALLEVAETPEVIPAEPRFRMLETVREYALARLAASGEADAITERHTRYFLALAEQGEHALLENLSGLEWLARLECEFDNLRAAIRRTSDAGLVELELRLAAALGPVRILRGYWTEGLGDLIEALSHGHGAPPAIRAKALGYAAYMAATLNDFARAGHLVDEGLPLARASADPLALAWLLYTRAALALREGRGLSEALASAEKAIALLQVAGSKLAGLLRMVRWRYAINLLALGELDQSRQLHEQNRADALASGDAYVASCVLVELGTIALLRADLERAAAHFSEGLEQAARVGDPTLLQLCLDALAVVASRRGQSRRSAVFLGAANKVRDHLGFTPALTHRLRERIGFAAAIDAARAALGGADFDTARQAGFALSSDEALAEALNVSLGPIAEPAETTRPGPLEVEGMKE